MDHTVLNFFVGLRTDWLSFLMMVATYAGSTIIISGLTFLVLISFYFHKHYNRILPLIITVGGSTVTTYIIKHLFMRPRPLEAMYIENTSSFPSGHATAAMALYGFLIYTLWKHDKHTFKKPLMIFLALLITLIGISRLYLGVHYLSDVLAGYAIGLIWLFVGIKLQKYLLKREQKKTNSL
jgi:membrane-associated phospholipid phosphatase